MKIAIKFDDMDNIKVDHMDNIAEKVQRKLDNKFDIKFVGFDNVIGNNIAYFRVKTKAKRRGYVATLGVVAQREAKETDMESDLENEIIRAWKKVK